MSELTELKGHTPGPWKWHREDASLLVLTGPDEMLNHVLSVSKCKACQERDGDCLDPDTRDAALITAAPDLLEIANDLAKKLASAGQPQQAYAAFASRGLAPPEFVRREATGEDA